MDQHQGMSSLLPNCTLSAATTPLASLRLALRPSAKSYTASRPVKISIENWIAALSIERPWGRGTTFSVGRRVSWRATWRWLTGVSSWLRRNFFQELVNNLGARAATKFTAPLRTNRTPSGVDVWINKPLRPIPRTPPMLRLRSDRTHVEA